MNIIVETRSEVMNVTVTQDTNFTQMARIARVIYIYSTSFLLQNAYKNYHSYKNTSCLLNRGRILS